MKRWVFESVHKTKQNSWVILPFLPSLSSTHSKHNPTALNIHLLRNLSTTFFFFLINFTDFTDTLLCWSVESTERQVFFNVRSQKMNVLGKLIIQTWLKWYSGNANIIPYYLVSLSNDHITSWVIRGQEVAAQLYTRPHSSKDLWQVWWMCKCLCKNRGKAERQ